MSACCLIMYIDFSLILCLAMIADIKDLNFGYLNN